LASGVESFSFTPLERTELKIPGSEQPGFTLQPGKEFIFYRRQIVPEWEIQVFATSDSKKADFYREKLNNEGFNSFVRQDEEIFKILIGYYEEHSARALAADLEDRGWSTWVKRSPDQNTTRLVSGIFTARGELIAEGKIFEITGSINIEDRVYPGSFELIAGNNGLKIYNTVDIEIVNSGLLDARITDPEETNRELLKSMAVITRSYLLHILMAEDQSQYVREEYRGLPAEAGPCQQAVANTAAEIIAGESIDGPQIFDNTFMQVFTTEKYGDMMAKLMDHKPDYYKDLLVSVFGEDRVFNLADIVIEEKKLTAGVFYGLDYQEIRQRTWWGPRVITVLKLELDLPHFIVDTALAGEEIMGTAELPEIISNADALAGVNGGYFSYRGQPLGFLMSGGRIVSEPLKNRTALAVTEENEVLIGPIHWQGRVINHTTGEQLEVNAVNRSPAGDEIALFNTFYGARVMSDERVEVQAVITDGKVESISETGQEVQIPKEGFLLQSRKSGELIKDQLSVGDRVEFCSYYPRWLGKKLRMAVEAGPRLLDAGEISITGQEEEFQPDILLGRAPRTAAGISDNNQLLLVTVDGRQAELSVGMTLEELAEFMRELGAEEAVNLDGGSSARMVVRGFTMNNPGIDKSIASAIYIKKQEIHN
ncbi:MAG: phosphodiester glycosidase family protein, partial [Halanaerobiales bacterium]